MLLYCYVLILINPFHFVLLEQPYIYTTFIRILDRFWDAYIFPPHSSRCACGILSQERSYKKYIGIFYEIVIEISFLLNNFYFYK